MKKLLLLSILSLSSLEGSEPYPTEYWAVRNGVSNFQISSDGTYISYLYIASKNSDPVIHIKNTNDLTKEPQVIGADIMEVQSHSWVDNTRMVINFRQKTRENIKGFNDGIYDYKSALLDVKKGKFTELEKMKSGTGQNSIMIVENSLPYDKNNILVGYADTAGKSGGSSYSYYKLNLNNFKKRLVLKGNSEFGNIRFNAKGKPLTASSFDYAKGDYVSYYRDYNGETEGKEWIEYHRISEDSFESFSLLGADLDEDGEFNNIIFVAAQNGRDKEGVWTYDLKERKFLDLVFEHPKVDVYGPVNAYDSDKYSRKFVGVSTFSNKYKRYYFDYLDGASELEAFYSQLEEAIPNSDQVSIVDRSLDDRYKIISNRGPNDPGSYYLMIDNQIQFLANVKPFLEPDKLADVKYIRYPSSDGVEVAAYVHIPKGKGPFPLVVIPHGGPFVSETVAWDSVSQFFANHGYMVAQPQYRGSYNYGMKFHMDSFINGGQGGRLMQDDKDYSAKFLVNAGLVDPSRIFMWGGSYGGYASLLAANNDMYKCAMGFAVVSDMKQQLSYYANRMSGSQEVRQKSYRVGSISPIDVVDEVKIPLLIIHGDKDQRTPIKHAYKYVDGLKKNNKDHKFVVLEGADHFFSSLTYDHFMTLFDESINFMETCGN